MNNKAVNVVRIPTSLETKFFRYWFDFLVPLHKLKNREIDIITSFLKHRYELSKVIKDPELLEEVTMSEETKKKVRIDCNIKQPHFQVVMGKLRKHKVIINNRINPRFIPNVSPEDNNFKLLLLFDFNEKERDNKPNS